MHSNEPSGQNGGEGYTENKQNHTTNQLTSQQAKGEKRSNSVLPVVPTDKINSVRLMKTVQYMNAVTQHLAKDAVKCDSAKLDTIHKEALKMLATLEYILSQNEFNYIKSTINKRAVPTVCLLIKDHKKRGKEGDFLTRLVVPAKNFTAGFPHVGQHGIKNS